MSRHSVDVFQITAAAVWWRGQTFAFDGKQLLEIMVTDAFDHDVIHRHDPDVCITSRSLKRFLQETDGIKTLTTRSFVQMQAQRLVQVWLVCHLGEFGPVTPDRKLLFDERHNLLVKCSGIQHHGIRRSDGWRFGRFVGDH